MTLAYLTAELARKIKGKVWQKEPLARHTTLHLGGPADLLAEPLNAAEVEACLHFATQKGLPVYILGNGSNLLVKDGGVRGLVVKMTALKDLEIKGELVRVGAGVSLPHLVACTTRKALAGLEILAGIPASLGGAIVMNAGTPEGSLGNYVGTVRVLREGKWLTLNREDLEFDYRRSRLLTEKLVVVSADLHLTPGDSRELKQRVAKRLAHRRQSQPLEYPNCGSIFKNPPGDFAGRLIELAGAKGWRCGGAEVAVKHANFIVNRGGAKAGEVMCLIKRVREAVWQRLGILLELEIEVWGEDP